jgi:alpha-galactosidase
VRRAGSNAEALRANVMERLSLGSEELEARPVTADAFLTVVVQSLNWDFDAHITSIDNDQWSAVTTEKYDGSVRYYGHCDSVEVGVA